MHLECDFSKEFCYFFTSYFPINEFDILNT